MKDLVRHNDHLGRWGGEEFVIILPDTNAKGGGKFVEKLRQLIEEHDFGLESKLTVSIGYGQYESGEKLAAFISRIDNSLYRAKEQGRNMVIHAE